MMVFWRKFYENMEVKVVLFGLLMIICTLNEAESDCQYKGNLETGETYYAYNPLYPDKNNGYTYCKWELDRSENMLYDNSFIEIHCNITISTTANVRNECTEGLFIQFAGKKGNTYCKDTSVIFEEGNTSAIIEFFLQKPSSESKFMCVIRRVLNKCTCKCGWKKQTRVVGGEETGINEYPMMCGLLNSENGIIYCGCTIISEHYVITAAHCIIPNYLNIMKVVVGEHDVTTEKETKATKVFNVSHCIVHPKDFNSPDNKNDIAVCKIIGIILYSTEVGPVCLPFQHKSDSFGGAIVTALGWGLTSFAGAKATKLQKVDLNVLNPETCICKTNNYALTERNMCTSTEGKDTCQMDSGGPVLWQSHTDNNVLLAGITSEGAGCASDEPAIDMRVGHYMDWISNVTGEELCKAE